MKIPETGTSGNANFSAKENAEGIFITFDIPKDTDAYELYIEGIGLVTENYFGVGNKTKDDFFYPFLTPDKDYAIRVKFLKKEVEKDGWNLGRPDDGIIGWFDVTAKAGADSKGEVRFTSKGQIDVKKNGDFKFIQKPTFQNEDLLGNDWEVEIGLVEGVSWEHGDERRTYWHSMQESIPSDKLTETINLYKKCVLEERGEYSIDFICVRPILYYTHTDGKTYKYQWDSFVEDIYYPPIENPDLIHGIYVEFDESEIPAKKEYSRCDVTIDGIGKVSEMIYVDESTNKGYFFYPFVEPGKEYTVLFSFKKIERTQEGFTIPTPDDTLFEVTKKVTAGSRAKGEVIPSDKWAMGVDNDYNIHTFEKFEAENEDLFEGKWLVEIGLMEGISWEHGDERRTKWHCAVYIPNESIHGNSVNLRKLCQKQHSDEPSHQANHEIDCICVRPIMWYTQDDKEYKYQWVGFTYDVFYPPKSWFEEIDINDSSQLEKINGTWKSDLENVRYDEENIHYIQCETLKIDSNSLEITSSYEIMKYDDSVFTEEEKNICNEQIYPKEHLCIFNLNYNCDYFHSEILNGDKVISKKYVCSSPISQYFEGPVSDGMRQYNYKLNLSKDEKILRISRHGAENSSYQNYYRQ